MPNKQIFKFLKKYWWFWGICVLLIIIYRETFNLYFFQDDFFSLNTSRVESFGEWIRLWLPNQNVVYYRPLGIPLFFWLGQIIFGTNFLGFRLVAFLVFLATVFLVYKLALVLTREDRVAKLTAFFYGVAPLHFLSLAWIVNFSYVLGAFFYFLIIYFYFRSLKEPLMFKISTLTFGLGVLTNEIVLMAPVAIFLIDLIFRKKLIFRNYLIFLSIIIPYFVLRIWMPPMFEGMYRVELDLKSIFSTLRWYIIWVFGWPELMKDQFISIFRVNPVFILSSFGKELMVMEIFLGWFLFLLVVLPLVLILKRRKIKEIMPKIVFCAAWFLINLLPFLVLPKHAYPHYGAVASFGVYLLLSVLVFKGFEQAKDFVFLRWLVLGVVVGSWMGLAFVVMRFNLLAHWAPKHAELAKNLLTGFKKFYPINTAVPHVDIYIVDNHKEKELVLAEKNAIQFFYQDKKVDVFYITSDMAVQQFGGNYVHKVEELKQKGIYLAP